ncbi:hypothetical protein MEQU1_002100 [Malassezia equina]|uniref:Cytochrome P450 n=1 Tax=Malassezia equina TaxID=1381935 RepID=A0AAF0EF39_9BASI|nr:hypothetical protein MEQU1_002100 [Malassezia equina]
MESSSLPVGKDVLSIVGVSIALVLALPVVFVLNQIIGGIYRMTIGEWFTPWKHIPKVKQTDPLALFFGDFRAIKSQQPADQHVKWMNELGPVYRYRHMFQVHRILLADPKAMSYVLSPAKAYQYPKPEYTSAFLTAVLGEGLVSIEGEKHARQRKIIAPAFAPGVVKEYQPVIHRHAKALVEKINEIIKEENARRAGKFGADHLVEGQAPSDRSVTLQDPAHQAVVDVLFWLSRTTLDIIGEVGFSFMFDSLNHGDKDPLANAMNILMGAILDLDLSTAILVIMSEKPGLKWLRYLPTSRRMRIKSAKKTVEEHATVIVDRLRNEILAENQGVSKDLFDDMGDARPKSLVSRMIRANMATDLKPSERMSNAELMGQMTTLIIAGHETTATQNSWALWLLAMHPEVQDKLRKVLQEAVAKENAEKDDLPEEEQAIYENQPIRDINSIKYLDDVVKECVRMLPSIPSTLRVALKDDVVPLSRPYKRVDGKGTYNSVFIPKGHELFIPLNVISLSKDLWGEDAQVFNPDRWDNIPKSVIDAKMPPGQTFSFLAGPRSCVGKGIAFLETQVIIAHLLLNFKFDIVPNWDLVQRQQIVRRAFVEGQWKEGIRMPLIVTPLNP